MKAGGHDDRTRLQRWLDDEGFTSAALERATPEISRSGMQKIRGTSDVRRRTMRLIQRGACVIAKRYVRIDELFDFYTHEEWSTENDKNECLR